VPVATAGIGFSLLYVTVTAGIPSPLQYTIALASLALLLSLEAFGLLYLYMDARPRLKQLGRERDFLQRRAKFLEGRLTLLEEDVEVLAAMRQVQRAAAAHDGLDRVLEETLRIVQELVSAEWVSVFIYDDKAHMLIPAAHRRGKANFLGKKIPPALIDDTNVNEAFEHGSVIKAVEDDRLQAAIPALTAGQKLGVVAVSAPLSGTPEEKNQRVEVFETALKDVAEHIAYALRALTLQARAYEDDLTGLGNRGLFDERLGELIALALRKNQSLSLILVDLDHFKNVNDTYGHQMGDRVLREVARLLIKNLRRYDTGYRYGGEELALLLPQTDIVGAVRLAERIRIKLERRTFAGGKFRVTGSFGVASIGGSVLTQEALIAAADAQVYKAKDLGRNRVEPTSPLAAKRQ